MIKTLQSKVTQTEEKVSALQDFQQYVRDGDASYIKQHFKYTLFRSRMLLKSSIITIPIIRSRLSRKLLKMLLDSLTNDNKKMQVEVLQTLIEMLKCPELVDSFSLYPELLVLKVINAYKTDDQTQDTSTSSNSRNPVSV